MLQEIYARSLQLELALAELDRSVVRLRYVSTWPLVSRRGTVECLPVECDGRCQASDLLVILGVYIGQNVVRPLGIQLAAELLWITEVIILEEPLWGYQRPWSLIDRPS